MIGKFLGILAIIPTTVLLTISFFVMVVLRKIEEGALKSFGRIIAALLCIAAILVYAIGLYTVAAGYCPVLGKFGKCGVSRIHGKTMHGYMHKPMEGRMHKGMMRK